jgi:hypothetical protein
VVNGNAISQKTGKRITGYQVSGGVRKTEKCKYGISRRKLKVNKQKSDKMCRRNVSHDGMKMGGNRKK